MPSPAIQDGMGTSPFAKLPAELRGMIWDLVFTDLWVKSTVVLLRDLRVDSRMQYRDGHPRLHLLLTCKQISQKAGDRAWRNVTAALDCFAVLTGRPTDAFMVESLPTTHIREIPQRLLSEHGHRLGRITNLQIGHRFNSQLAMLLTVVHNKLVMGIFYANLALKAVTRSFSHLRRLTVHSSVAGPASFEGKEDAVVQEYLKPLPRWTPSVRELVVIGRKEVRRIHV